MLLRSLSRLGLFHLVKASTMLWVGILDSTLSVKSESIIVDAAMKVGRLHTVVVYSFLWEKFDRIKEMYPERGFIRVTVSNFSLDYQ